MQYSLLFCHNENAYTMKKYLFIPLALALTAMISCGGKNETTQTEEVELKTPQKEEQAAPIAEKSSKREYTDTIDGRIYRITIERHHDESLPIVEDVIGTKFYDNVVTLAVKSGNEEVYRHAFRKKQFLEYLSEDDIEHGTLAGMGYFKEESKKGKLIFTSQVCMPGMDGGTFLRLELSTDNWRLKIKRDETIDMEIDRTEYEEGV